MQSSFAIPSDLQHRRMSIRPKTVTASATADKQELMFPSQRMPRIRCFQPSRSLRVLLHSPISSRNSALRCSWSISWGGKHAITWSPWDSSWRINRTANGDSADVMSHVRGELCVAAGCDSSSAMAKAPRSTEQVGERKGLRSGLGSCQVAEPSESFGEAICKVEAQSGCKVRIRFLAEVKLRRRGREKKKTETG